jgi:putative hydrolase of the HAD superfamily
VGNSRVYQVKALVLDFGGVISRTMFETHDLSEAALGLPSGTLTWRGPFDPASDALWQTMQAGDISERDYWLARAKEIGALLGEEWTDMRTLVKRARGADPSQIIRPEAVAAIDAAKAMGCRLAILSNELDLFYGADFRSRLSLLNLFDVIVDATYTKILKPDARAYQQCMDELGILDSANIVFVDDQLKNVQGALAMGWRAIELDVKNPNLAFKEALSWLQL